MIKLSWPNISPDNALTQPLKTNLNSSTHFTYQNQVNLTLNQRMTVKTIGPVPG